MIVALWAIAWFKRVGLQKAKKSLKWQRSPPPQKKKKSLCICVKVVLFNHRRLFGTHKEIRGPVIR